MTKYTMKLKTIAETHELQPVHLSSDYETKEIGNYSVMRPSLQLTGFYDYFDASRIQILGKAENAYLRSLPEDRREEAVDQLFAHHIPALVVCHRVLPDELMVDAARRYDTCLFATDMETSEFVAQVLETLHQHLAPRMSRHGVLVAVHGEGVLITGESGIGKSEVALELVKRGHRLVADDSVIIRRVNRELITGSAPKMIRYLMELRGVGIIDVRRLYGVGAVLPYSPIDLQVHFVRWEQDEDYDRLGLEDEYASYLGVRIPKVTIPVAPARNLAIILEVAAMNNRQKKLGYNTAQEFMKRHDQSIDNGAADF